MLRAPDPAYVDQLIEPAAPSQAALLSAAAAAAAPPLISLDRLVDRHQADALRCRAGCDHVPTDIALIDCACIVCMDCRRQIRSHQPESDDDDDNDSVMEVPPRPAAVAKCPGCRTPMPAEHRSNKGLVGQVCRQLIHCVHHPACTVTFPIGLTFKGEEHHRQVCLFEPVSTCPNGCGVGPLPRGSMKAHQESGQCPRTPVLCHQCNERVPLEEFEEHAKPDGELSVWCLGMVSCPYGCSRDGKKQRKEADAVEPLVVRMLRPCDVEAHKLECPCRPVTCEVEGCHCPLLHHEIARHKRKFQTVHEAIARATAPLKEKLAELRGVIHSMVHQPQAHPFPGFQLKWQGVFKLPERGLLTKFRWASEQERPWKLPVDHEVDGITAIQFEPVRASFAKESPAPNEVRPNGRHLCVTVQFVPNIAEHEEVVIQHRPREMGICIRVLAAFDRTKGHTREHQTRSLDNHEVELEDGGSFCLNDGIQHARFTSSFTNTTNVQSVSFEAFELKTLRMIREAHPQVTQAGHFALAVELYEQ